MRTIEYLTTLGGWYWPGVVAAVVVGLLASCMSVVVVLKRLAFIGQGVSHAAFGGVGLAFVLGLVGGSTGSELGLMGVVLVFSVAAALFIAWLSDRPQTRPDTAIGIVLAASMALGFVLFRIAAERAQSSAQPPPPALESVLFGSVLEVQWADAWLALGLAAGVIAAGWWHRRPLLFWAFDESACPAFGVRASRMRALLLVLLAIAVVVTMKLVGIVLATALFVLPGATALQLTDRLGRSMALSIVAGLVGVLGGLVLSFETDVEIGPTIVLVLIALFAAARLGSGARTRSPASPADA